MSFTLARFKDTLGLVRDTLAGGSGRFHLPKHLTAAVMPHRFDEAEDCAKEELQALASCKDLEDEAGPESPPWVERALKVSQVAVQLDVTDPDQDPQPHPPSRYGRT